MGKYDLEEILPHKKPMVLIDDVVDYNLEEKWVKTLVKITPGNLLFDNEINGISPVTGIEFMAQTIGAYAYFENGQKPPKIGFLLGTREYNINIPKFENEKIYYITAKEVYTDNSIVSFECIIYNERNEICANVNINVYVPKTEEEVREVLND